jgi:competence ComEA-like helix-hairpin-helix protein
MADTVNVPAFAWYRLHAREAAALLVLLLVFSGLATAAMLTRGRTREVSVTHEEPPPARVNVNKAGIAELSALPGIGAKKAEKIIEARKQAPIENLEQLAKAAGGISSANLERMKPFVNFAH